ncbi:MAG: tetratricopeptide repeat protein [Planctomycetes bacterium]|nr:tetratricopeptide repeat protein [Planctomycetota bacterium]
MPSRCRSALFVLLLTLGCVQTPRDRSDDLVLVHHRPRNRPLADRMEREVFGDRRIEQLLSDGVTLRVQSDADQLATELFSSDGHRLGRISGFLSASELETRLRWASERQPEIRELSQRLMVNDRDHQARLRLSRIWRDLGETDEARRCLGTNLDGDDTDWSASRDLALARIDLDEGMIAAASERLSRVSHSAEVVGTASFRLAQALVLMGQRRPAEALTILEALEAEAEMDERDRVLFEIGLAAHEVGRHARAIEALDELIHDAPQSPFAYRAPARRAQVLQRGHGHSH